jgi:hypothetical protein
MSASVVVIILAIDLFIYNYVYCENRTRFYYYYYCYYIYYDKISFILNVCSQLSPPIRLLQRKQLRANQRLQYLFFQFFFLEYPSMFVSPVPFNFSFLP